MIGQQSASGIQVAKASALYEDKSAQSVIRWALDTYGGRAAVCTSFQAEGMVVLDMACQIDPGVRVFTIDTGRMPQETYDLIDAVRERYGMVRHRESILPFDLVFQGSFSTLSLGAFPRMRKPKETPDAFLYR